MKNLIIIIFICSGIMFAQSASDSTQSRKQNEEREQIREQKTEINQVQENIGPKNNPNSTEKGNGRKKDIFIDKDGDGICDTRQSGMSFNKMRKRLGSGQKGPSKGQHGSGSGNGNGN